MMVFALLESTVRPYTTNLLLGLNRRDTGSASALINFMHTIVGVVGMTVIMAPFPDYIAGIGVLLAASMLLAFVLWIAACRSR